MDSRAPPLPALETGAADGAALVAWLVAHRADLDAALARDGFALLGGPADLSPAEVSALIDALGLGRRAYGEGLARRVERAPGVYAATMADSRTRLALHAELAHTARPPDRLLLRCARPADTGGETTLADGAAVPAALGAERWAAWRDRRLAYWTCRPPAAGPLALGRSWPQVYGTEDRAVVAAALQAEGATGRWDEAGFLHTRREGPVAGRHPTSGAVLWCNHLLLWHTSALGERGARLQARLGRDRLPHACTWADGTPIPEAEVAAVRAAIEGLARPVAWRAGDLLLVDNRRMMHGRLPYTGARDLSVSLCDLP